MNARSALFYLYGDHLAARGGRAPVAALIRLLAPLRIAAPAVRTAISRMARQGWLTPIRLPDGPGYALTPKATRWLADPGTRVHRRRLVTWDGHWHLLVVPRAQERARRDRLRNGLVFLGYAPLDDITWIGPRQSAELDTLLEAAGVSAERFTAAHEGDSVGLVRRLWDLDGLAQAYRDWQTEAEAMVSTLGERPDEEQSFATRAKLVHEWGRLLFRDPGLPVELLPEDWPGERAAAFFDAESGRLWPAASRFVDACLTGPHGE